MEAWPLFRGSRCSRQPDRTATITGTLAEVNLALASVYYLGDPNFCGPDTLTMTSRTAR